MKYIGILAVLLVAAMLLGCTGGQQTPAPAAPASSQPQVPPNAQGGYVGGPTSPDSASVGGSQTPAGGSTEPAQPASTSATDDFTAMMVKVKAAQFKAVYETMAAGQPLEMTIVMKDGNMRTDTKLSGQLFSSTYKIGEKYYSCTFIGGTTSCQLVNVPATTTSDPTTDPSKYVIVAKAPRTVIGILGTCYGISGGGLQGDMEYCYSADGIMLYTAVTAQGQTSVTEAKSVQVGNVADSEFTLPAEATSSITIPAGYGDYSG